MGEGAALLVLEAAEVAARRGATPYAELLGYGATSDAHHMVQPRADGTRGGAGRVDRPRRRRRATRRRSTTSTRTPRRRRSATWPRRGRSRLALGERAATVPVSGTKALYGHPLGASGAIEAAICALAIRDGWAPASVNLVEPDPERPRSCPACSARAATAPTGACCRTSFGFGGLNAALVFGAVEADGVGGRSARARASRSASAPRTAARRSTRSNAPRATPDEGADPDQQRQDAADGDRDGDPEGRGERAHRPARRSAPRREDRRVDAHHPAAEIVRDRQLDRRVGGRRHRDRRRTRSGPSARATTGKRASTASSDRGDAEDDRAGRRCRTGRGRPPNTSATARRAASRRPTRPSGSRSRRRRCRGRPGANGGMSDAEVHAERRDEPDDDDGQQHDRGVPDVARGPRAGSR